MQSILANIMNQFETEPIAIVYDYIGDDISSQKFDQITHVLTTSGYRVEDITLPGSCVKGLRISL